MKGRRREIKEEKIERRDKWGRKMIMKRKKKKERKGKKLNREKGGERKGDKMKMERERERTGCGLSSLTCSDSDWTLGSGGRLIMMVQLQVVLGG